MLEMSVSNIQYAELPLGVLWSFDILFHSDTLTF